MNLSDSLVSVLVNTIKLTQAAPVPLVVDAYTQVKSLLASHYGGVHP